MKCSVCDDTFTDGAECSVCGAHLHYACAKISEKGWNKLGTERKASWRCSTCKSSSLSPVVDRVGLGAGIDPLNMEVFLKEVREIKHQLSGLPSLIQDVKTIKDELSDLKNASEFMSGKLDDFATQILEIQRRVAKVESLQATVNSLESEIHSLKSLLSAVDQRSRLNNVEIKGIPLKKDENLFSIVESISKVTGGSFSKSQINFLHRSPLHGSKEKSIIVGFTNRYVKDDFAAAARACKTLSTSSLGLPGTNQRVYVNDHLNSDSKILLNKAKARAKDAKFSYVWVKHGKIHARRNDTSPVVIIFKEQDLNKIA